MLAEHRPVTTTQPPLVTGGGDLQNERAKPRSGRDGRSVSLRYGRGMALTLRTDDELERALTALTEQEGLSRQEIIRRAVLERFERAEHQARVDDSAQRMVDRWCDVLERLGSV